MKGYELGERVELEGVIVSQKYGRNAIEYAIYTSEGKFSFFSSENLPKGSEIVADGVVSSLLPLSINAKTIVEKPGIYQKVADSIEEKAALRNFLLDNQLTMRLGDRFRSISKRLYSAKELNRFVLLRFHGDADGISGALALGSAITFMALQQNSAVYQQRDVVSDMGAIYHEKRPLVVLLDFGSNDKSSRQLELLRASGAEIILIDHHPLGKETAAIPHLLLSPWLLDGLENPSSYTAGYLASELAALLGVESAKYARIACAGDKSTICPVSQEDQNAALVLDYLASNATYRNNLAFYRDVLGKSEPFHSVLAQAKQSIDEATDKAIAKMKKIGKESASVFVVPLSGLIKKGEFPTSSKIATAVLDRVKGQGPAVVIAHRTGAIILRADRSAVEAGIDLSAIIDKISLRFGDFINSGGGHATAAAIHTHPGYEHSIIEALLEHFK